MVALHAGRVTVRAVRAGSRAVLQSGACVKGARVLLIGQTPAFTGAADQRLGCLYGRLAHD